MDERYEVMYGPNTNQWWVYDSKEDVYIDPPKALLDEIKNTCGVNGQVRDMKKEQSVLDRALREQKVLEETLQTQKCHWLNDKHHWYKEVEI